MKLKTHLLVGLVAAAIVPTTASAFLQNYTFDITGSGNTAGDGVTKVGEYLDIVGTSYVNPDISSGGPPGVNYPFTDFGAFQVAAADGVGSAFDNVVGSTVYESTMIFNFSGTVDIPGGITFSPFVPGEKLDWYVGSTATGTYNFGTATNASTAGVYYGANDGTLIGSFELDYGVGNVDPTGIPNGIITVRLDPTYLAPGYFKDKDGKDLSTMVDAVQGNGPLFNFITTNASLVTGTIPAAFNSDIIQAFAGDPSLTASDVPNRFVVGNNGQDRWTIPEPGSLALLGIGLLGGIASRRFRA